MVVFRNKYKSIMYYFKKKAGGAITQVALPGAKDNAILWTSVVSTSDDNFHAVWGVYQGRGRSILCRFRHHQREMEHTDTAVFPICRGYAPAGQSGEQRHRPVHGFGHGQLGSTKNIFVMFRKNGQTTWTDDINISNQTCQPPTPTAHFDEQGYLHVVWKEDRGADDLIIKAALVKKNASGTYTLVDKQWVTSDYNG